MAYLGVSLRGQVFAQLEVAACGRSRAEALHLKLRSQYVRQFRHAVAVERGARWQRKLE